MEALWLEKPSYTRVVVIFHAYTGSPADVRLLANFLHRQGYNVYVPVFSGHEHGVVEEVLASSPTVWWEDAKRAVEWVRARGYQTVAAFGLSMGGIMAAGLAVHQLVEMAGTFCSPVSTRNAQLPGLMETFLAFAKASGETDMSAIQAQATVQMGEIQTISSQFAEQLSDVTGPFYIAQAGQDLLVDPEVSIEMKEQLVNAAVDFHWFEESGHVVTVGPERQLFQETVLEFLDQQEWR